MYSLEILLNLIKYSSFLFVVDVYYTFKTSTIGIFVKKANCVDRIL